MNPGSTLPVLALTAGEPAGIGPDLCIKLSQQALPCRLCVLGDVEVLRARAAQLGIVVDFITPETETSIWYFWGMARNFRPEDKALTASIRDLALQQNALIKRIDELRDEYAATAQRLNDQRLQRVERITAQRTIRLAGDGEHPKI